MSARFVLLFALPAIVACGENTSPSTDSTDAGPTVLERDTASLFTNDSLTLSVPIGPITNVRRVGQPQHGVTRMAGSRISYSPSRDFVGVDSFDVTGSLLTSAITHTLTVVVGVRPGPFVITPIEERGIEVIPASMNERGQVVGHYRLADSSVRAFRWSAGVFEELRTPTGKWSRALHLNNLGHVTGLTFDPDGYWVGLPVLWRNASEEAQTIDSSITSGPLSINDRGEVLLDRVIWQGGTRRSLQFFDFVDDMNGRGDVLGRYISSPYSVGVIFRDGKHYGMPKKGRASFIAAMNDSGFGIGAGEDQTQPSGTPWKLMIFRPGADSAHVTTPVTVGYGPPIGDVWSPSRRTFNDRLWITATIRDSIPQPHNLGRPRLWISGAVFEIQDLLAEPDKWRVRSIAALNDAGQMAGLAIELATGKLRGVTLSPVAR